MILFFSGGNMFKLEDCLAYFANKEMKILTSELEQRIMPYGLTRVQWMALYYIHTNDKISQKRLADLMGSKQPTIAKLLDRMEDSDLIERIHQDKRTNFLCLTEKGKQLNQDILPVAEQFKNDAVAGISLEYLDIFEKVMKQMSKNVQK